LNADCASSIYTDDIDENFADENSWIPRDQSLNCRPSHKRRKICPPRSDNIYFSEPGSCLENWSPMPLAATLQDDAPFKDAHPKSQTKMAAIDLESQPLWFRYNRQYKVVICEECQSCIVPRLNSFIRHLRDAHRLLGGRLKAAQKWYQTLDLVNLEDIKPPKWVEQPVPAVPGIEVFKGFYCLRCTEWLSKNERRTQDHILSAHGLAGRKMGRIQYESCLMQTLSSQSCRIRYFRVREDNLVLGSSCNARDCFAA
jgi:hypothetical protein